MLRAFVDSTGVEWRVWSVVPNSNVAAHGSEAFSRSSLKDTAFINGWLCFECETEKRRLVPIPPAWELDDPARLAELCARATVVPARRTRAQRA